LHSIQLNNTKILQVIDRLEVGGAERVFLDLTSLLLNENIQIDTLLISARGPLFGCIDQRAGKLCLNRKWKFDPFKMLECARICSRYKIVHVHMRHTYAYVRLAQIISFKKFKIIFHDHFGESEMSFRSSFTLKGFFKPKYYIGVSQHLVHWATIKLNIANSRVFLLKNTIIPSDGSIKLKSNKDLLMISNIRPIKNIELAVGLANHLRRKLTIYGNAPANEYSENILKLIKASGYVELIQGENNVQRFLKNYSFALHTAHSETGPLVLMEYLARGLPFLAHAVGEVAEVLIDEIPECFVDSLDIAKWEEKISYLQNTAPSPEKLMSLFNKYFGAKKYIENCLNIYQQILA